MTTKERKNVSYNPIRSIAEDWALDTRNNKPYSGRSIQDFIKAVLNGKGGDFYYDASTNKYIIFADVESRELYLTDRETHADLVIGTFDAPANYTAEIDMTTPSSNVVLSGSTGNYIDFTFDVKSKSGSSTGEAVVATFTFNNSGNIKKVTQVYNAGTNVHFLADNYLSNGTNSVSVVITGRNTLVSAMAAVTYNVVAIDFTSTFDFSKPVESGQYLSIPYHLEGAGVKYVEWYIDGVVLQDVDTITDLRVNRIKNIDTTGLSAGKHNVQGRAYITSNGSNFYSTTLYYDFVVSPESEEWQSDVTYVLLGLVLDAPATSTISVNVKQYEAFEYLATIYDSRQRSLNMVISDNGTQVQSISMHYSVIESLSYSPTTTGNHTILFSADEATASFVVVAESGDVDINEVTDSLLLKLSAKGRSNSETNPAVWTYGNITTTFNNFDWNAISGWNNDALVIPVGSSIDIDFAPLGGNPLTNGRTIEIDYETSSIENDDASVIHIVNQSTNAGFNVTASTASLQSSGGANINTKYKDGDRVHLTFIINKVTGDNGRLMCIVNNGILERSASFASTDAFRVDDNFHIGSLGCSVKIHSIRVYDRALTIDEAFCNYAVDSDNLVEIADKNDILNPSTGLIDADKVSAKIPIMIITGDMQPIFDATDKNTTVYVDIDYLNFQNTSKNFSAEHSRMRPQGTSSLGYPRKNLRLYTSAEYGCTMTDANGDVLPDGMYSFKDKAQPVNCWTLKADYAESSGSHNTGAARLWNDLMYMAQINGEFALRTNAQKTALQNGYEYDVRTAIDGFPIVVFHRVNAESELVCLGQYNFNNDKSTESVFGFTGIPNFDDTHVQCFEFLENENPICLFDDVSNFDSAWAEAFESRYPDTKNPNLTPLKTLATWINSCKNNQTKWNNEKTEHFDLPKLAAYYVYLMRFGAVDQTVKNAMIETEDGVHWFFINYDNDTILGIDNISTVLNAWDYDRTTQKPGGAYYFAGHNSVLWNCFEADPECMALVSTVDDAMYGAGLTYANMIKMFDEEQCDKWCERIYNDNGAYKYIQPFKESGSAVLYMLQGSRKSYRHWWLQHRMDLYDAKWATGAFKSRIVRFIAEGAQGGTFTVTAASTTYFGYGINSVPQEVGVEIQKNASQDFTITKTLAIGDPVAIYNANNAKKIDLSDFITHLTTLYINQAVGNDGKSELKSLILGDGTSENIIFSEIGGLSVITSLEEIDIRGFKAITSIELSTLVNLNTFKAENSGLTSFVPATGCSLSTVTLPCTIQSISINSASVASLTYTPTKTLRSLSLRNVAGVWDAKSFVNTWVALFSDSELEEVELTLVGIDWTGMTAEQAIQIGKIGTKTLQGKFTLVSLSQADYEELVELYGANVFESEGSFIIDAPDTVQIAGPTSLMEGGSGTYTATAFPVTGATFKYLLYNGDALVTSQTDGQGKVYRSYGGVTLYEASGAVSVDSPLTNDVTLKVRAQLEGTSTYSDYITLAASKYTYPSSVNISGAGSIDQNGFNNYTKAFDTDNFNAEVLNVAWTLTSNNACSISASDNDGATIQVTNTPATALQVTLTCVVTFTGGVTLTATKTITLQLTYPNSVSISGEATIDDNGSFDYTKAFDTNNFTASVTNVAWSLTSNEYVAIESSNDNKATVGVPNGNPTAATLTLTCAVTLTGNVTLTGTKSISVDIIEEPSEWVDLGLPSGLLWCRHNVGATNPEDAGDYFAWGETTGYADAAARNLALGRSGGFDADAYAAGSAASIADDLTLAQDAANVNIGQDCRMPTSTEFTELINNTYKEWVTINGVSGWKFMKTDNHRVYIFLPAAGNVQGNTQGYVGTNGMYWASTYADQTNGAYYISYNSSDLYVGDSSNRFIGGTIRAVLPPPPPQPDAVDLGLPSGLKWASYNLGATAPEEYGLYFSWGNVAGHASSNGSTFDDGYDFGSSNSGPYASTPGASLTANIASNDASHDAAKAMLGGSWHMPTKDNFQELYDNTDNEWTTINGVYGRKFMKKTDHSVYIFFPAAGYGRGTSLNGRGSGGNYWSSSWYSADRAYRMYFDSSSVYPQIYNNRYYGYSVRAVQ